MSKKKKQARQEEEAGEAWLLPYSDLMTLLLAVFIVLFAVSKMDAEKAKKMSAVFTEEMMSRNYAAGTGVGTGGSGSGGGSGFPAGQTEIDMQSDLKEFLGEDEFKKLEDLKNEVDARLHTSGMDQSTSTMIDMRGLVVRLNNAIVFDPGSAEIKKKSEETLIEVADILNTTDNYIRIEGHTDNTPILYSGYSSNWELSSSRAINVVKFFIDKCGFSPDKLVAVGYGEFKPVSDNETEEGRAKNRRIDIIVLSAKYNNLEETTVK